MTVYHGLNAGRLGNQLWQIASTYGVAEALGQEPSFPPWDYQPYFLCPEEWFRNRNRRGLSVEEQVPHIDPRARVYLQDVRLWWDHRDDILGFFHPSDVALEVMGDPKFNWFWDIPVHQRLSVHVRRGDNVPGQDPGVPDKHLYHPLPTENYYWAAVRKLWRPGSEVIVFSDEPEWCRQNMERVLDLPVHVFEGGSPRKKEHEDGYLSDPFDDWIDLQFMAYCTSHVISNSTYAWWGAFLSEDPEPVYPVPWHGPKLDFIDASLQFPDDWKAVPC